MYIDSLKFLQTVERVFEINPHYETFTKKGNVSFKTQLPIAVVAIDMAMCGWVSWIESPGDGASFCSSLRRARPDDGYDLFQQGYIDIVRDALVHLKVISREDTWVNLNLVDRISTRLKRERDELLRRTQKTQTKSLTPQR